MEVEPRLSAMAKGNRFCDGGSLTSYTLTGHERPLSCQVSHVCYKSPICHGNRLFCTLPFTTVTPHTNGETSSSILLDLGFTRLPKLPPSLSSRSLLRVASPYPYSLHPFLSSRSQVNQNHEDHRLVGDPCGRCSGARNARREWICRPTTR